MTPGAASGERCDVIVNSGMGEPTECGSTLPCEYHPAPATGGLDVERLRKMHWVDGWVAGYRAAREGKRWLTSPEIADAAHAAYAATLAGEAGK